MASGFTTMLLVVAMIAPIQVRRPEGLPAHAASINGRVRDPSGSPLSGYTVVVSRRNSTDQYGTITSEAGEFLIEGIVPGMYDLMAARPGFPDFRMTDIVLDPDARKTLNVEIALTDTGTFASPLARRSGAAPPDVPGPALPVESSGIRRPDRSTADGGTAPVITARREEDFIPIRSRWDIQLPPWTRYPNGPNDVPYIPGKSSGPYAQSRFKGDYPIFGERWFLALTATSDTLAEARRLPISGPPSSERPDEPGFFSRGGQFQMSENVIVTADLFRGLTSFKPVDLRFRVTPVFNGSLLKGRETALVNIDVEKGSRRFDYQIAGLQESFIEARLPEASPKFDFISARAGIQQFNSDFRGFIFFDEEPGVRVFGNLRSNRYQYNAAYFYMLEKDTNSQLNTMKRRDQEVLVGNFYIQDFIKPGYTSQFSVHYNRDKPGFHIDKNGFLARPAPIGSIAPKAIHAIYIGWTGDGHLRRLNLNHALYQVLGRERPNPITGDVFGPRFGKINAQMAAVEVSLDRDWKRFRLSAFYASGDNNPRDNQSRGFDSIFDNVQFAGGDLSFWNRQSIRLSGTAVALNQRFSLHPGLRTSKEEGQSNFVNPGLYLINAGFDAELTPKLRGSLNVNGLSFVSTQVLETLLFQSHIRRNIGLDTGLGVQWRPLLSNNVIIKGGAAALIPAAGFKQIYTSKTLLSTFAELKLTY